jgi:hypothetical protein
VTGLISRLDRPIVDPLGLNPRVCGSSRTTIFCTESEIGEYQRFIGHTIRTCGQCTGRFQLFDIGSCTMPMRIRIGYATLLRIQGLDGITSSLLLYKLVQGPLCSMIPPGLNAYNEVNWTRYRGIILHQSYFLGIKQLISCKWPCNLLLTKKSYAKRSFFDRKVCN